MAAQHTHIPTTASHRVVVTPIASETGPTTATPIGTRINEPSVSYDATRDWTRSGTSRWKTVNQSVRWIDRPIPARNAAVPTTHAGAPTARLRVWSESG